MMTESSLFKKSTTPFRSELGEFELVAYEFSDGEHLALVAGVPRMAELPLVRIQSSCLTGTAFHALLCDCRQQLSAAVELIAENGSGCLLYMAQEGRSHGLVEKVNHLAAISSGSNTYDAAIQRGVDPDLRDYGSAAVMLADLLGSERQIRLLTNNPDKIQRLREAGTVIAERIPLETDPTDHNRAYLRTKKTLMGHLLTRV